MTKLAKVKSGKKTAAKEKKRKVAEPDPLAGLSPRERDRVRGIDSRAWKKSDAPKPEPARQDIGPRGECVRFDTPRICDECSTTYDITYRYPRSNLGRPVHLCTMCREKRLPKLDALRVAWQGGSPGAGRRNGRG